MPHPWALPKPSLGALALATHHTLRYRAHCARLGHFACAFVFLRGITANRIPPPPYHIHYYAGSLSTGFCTLTCAFAVLPLATFPSAHPTSHHILRAYLAPRSLIRYYAASLNTLNASCTTCSFPCLHHLWTAFTPRSLPSSPYHYRICRFYPGDTACRSYAYRADCITPLFTTYRCTTHRLRTRAAGDFT